MCVCVCVVCVCVCVCVCVWHRRGGVNSCLLFLQIVDNSEFWNGSLLAHFIVPNDPTAEIYLSEIFR